MLAPVLGVTRVLNIITSINLLALHTYAIEICKTHFLDNALNLYFNGVFSIRDFVIYSK